MKKIRVETACKLGERKIIEIIESRLTVMPDMPVPFGDDIAAVAVGDGEVAVLKTDMLVGKTDVPPKMTLWQAARKTIVMNVSDFASKGVQPAAALVALGLNKNMTQKDIEEIADGLNAGAREYGAFVVGGDTGEASDLIISVSLFGRAKKKALMLRSGSKAGDVLAVTGFFGKSSAGLRLLLDERCSASEDVRRALIDAVLMPKAQLAAGLALASLGVVSASIDSSDGLAWSLHELAKMNGVGFVVDNIPIADEVRRFAKDISVDALELALYGGEEYELVVTLKAESFAVAKATVEAVGGCLLPVGKATRENGVFLDVDGKRQLIEARGWEHFKSQL